MDNNNTEKAGYIFDKEKRDYVNSVLGKCKENNIDSDVIKAINTCMIKKFDKRVLNYLYEAAINGCMPEEIVYIAVLAETKGYEVACEAVALFNQGFDIASIKEVIEKCNNSAYKLSFVRKNIQGCNDADESRDIVIEKFIQKAGGILNELLVDRQYYSELLDKVNKIIETTGNDCEELKALLMEKTCSGDNDTEEIKSKLQRKEKELSKLKSECAEYQSLYNDSKKRFNSLQKDYGKLLKNKEDEEQMTERQVNMLLQAFEGKNKESIAILKELACVRDRLGELEALLTKAKCENHLLKSNKLTCLFGGMGGRKKKIPDKASMENEDDCKKRLLKAMMDRRYSAIKMSIISTGLDNDIPADALLDVVKGPDMSADELKAVVNILSGTACFDMSELEDIEKYTDESDISEKNIVMNDADDYEDDEEYPEDDEEV